MEGYEHLRKRLRIEPGIETDLGDVPFGREAWIAGRIVDEAGNGIAAHLQVDPYDGASKVATRPMSIESQGSNGEGLFRVGNLSRGVYLFRVRDRDGPWPLFAKLVDTSSGPIDDLEIELVRGVPLLLSSSDERWSAVRYTIFDSAGLPLVSSQLWSPEPWKILLAPGSYEIEARLAGAPDSARRIPITIGSEVVQIALP